VKENLPHESTSQLQEDSKAQAHSDPTPIKSDEDTAPQNDAPYPSSFAEIVALITAGKPIPGIREIPPTVLEDQVTKPVASKRRKPWEKEDTEVSVEGGTFGDRRDVVLEQDFPEY